MSLAIRFPLATLTIHHGPNERTRRYLLYICSDFSVFLLSLRRTSIAKKLYSHCLRNILFSGKFLELESCVNIVRTWIGIFHYRVCLSSVMAKTSD
ncbi:hypothetical protein Plhal304r1_c028g0093821 [Plasmopara halstedii]